MRSLKKILKRRDYLGKWVRLSIWDDDDRYYCVGISDKFIYLWWGYKFDFGRNIYQYPVNEDWFEFDSCVINNSYKYTSWIDVESFNCINFNNYNFLDDSNIRWIR